jgi:hypothetical protein
MYKGIFLTKILSQDLHAVVSFLYLKTFDNLQEKWLCASIDTEARDFASFEKKY